MTSRTTNEFTDGNRTKIKKRRKNTINLQICVFYDTNETEQE